MAKDFYHEARAAFGRAALIIDDHHGHEIASDTIRGVAHAAILALGDIIGWDRTLREINEVAAAARSPAEIEKPKLSVIKGGRAA